MIYDEDDGFFGWLSESGSPFYPWIGTQSQPLDL